MVDCEIDRMLVAREIVRDVDVYSPERLEAVFNDARAQHDWKARSFFMTLRVALTGKTVSPPLFAVMAALGRERTEARLTDDRGRLVAHATSSCMIFEAPPA